MGPDKPALQSGMILFILKTEFEQPIHTHYFLYANKVWCKFDVKYTYEKYPRNKLLLLKMQLSLFQQDWAI